MYRATIILLIEVYPSFAPISKTHSVRNSWWSYSLLMMRIWIVRNNFSVLISSPTSLWKYFSYSGYEQTCWLSARNYVWICSVGILLDFYSRSLVYASEDTKSSKTASCMCFLNLLLCEYFTSYEIKKYVFPNNHLLLTYMAVESPSHQPQNLH